MPTHSHITNLSRLVALVAAGVFVCGRAWAQADLAIELKEAQATQQVSAVRLVDLESRLGKAKEQVNTMAEALASANGDSQQAREAYEKLRIQMEGLGAAALDASNAELQQRLLTALSDLRLMEMQKRGLKDALIALTDSSLAFAKAALEVDAPIKENLHNKLALAEKALANLDASEALAEDVSLQDAKVVSFKEDAGVAVFNVGSRHGVHPGMPFSIYRQDKPVAHALVVDVRQGICGAVIQELVSKDEPVKVGDTGKVEAAKS